jgi:hypothetical protein
MYVNRSEQEHLARRPGRQGLRHKLSGPGSIRRSGERISQAQDSTERSRARPSRQLGGLAGLSKCKMFDIQPASPSGSRGLLFHAILRHVLLPDSLCRIVGT